MPSHCVTACYRYEDCNLHSKTSGHYGELEVQDFFKDIISLKSQIFCCKKDMSMGQKDPRAAILWSL